VSQAAQAREALGLANKVRSQRSRLKMRLRLGEEHPQTIICDPPEWMETADLKTVLESSKGIGPVKAARIANRAGVSLSRSLGSLEASERRNLTIVLVQMRSK